MEQNNIKTIRTYTTSEYISMNYKGKLSDERHLSSIREFDKNNNVIKEITYLPTGEIEHNTTSEYDYKNNIIVNCIFDENNELLQRHEYERDAEGKITVEKCFYAESDEPDFTYYKYDQNNNLVEKVNMDSDNDIYSRHLFAYENNLLVKSTLYNDSNQLEHEKNMQYNNQGQLILELDNDYIDNIKRTFKYEYDEFGNRSKILIYNKNNQLISKSLYTFNEQRLTTELIEEDINGEFTTKFNYNEQKLMISQEKFDADDDLILRFEYIYEGNNLIKTKTFVRDNDLLEMESELEDNMICRAFVDYEYEFFE